VRVGNCHDLTSDVCLFKNCNVIAGKGSEIAGGKNSLVLYGLNPGTILERGGREEEGAGREK
jgi:hypothetical protein